MAIVRYSNIDEKIEALELRLLNCKNNKQLGAIHQETSLLMLSYESFLAEASLEDKNDLTDILYDLGKFKDDIPDTYAEFKERRQVRQSYTYTLICNNID